MFNKEKLRMTTQKKTFTARLLDCVRELNSLGLIQNNVIEKSRLYKKDIAPVFWKCICATAFLQSLLSKRIVLNPKETGTPHLVTFCPGKLDLILEGNDNYVLQSQNKHIIAQNLSFKKAKHNTTDICTKCAVCDRIFDTMEALNQHAAAKHDKNIVKKLSSAKNDDNLREKMFFLEYVRNRFNLPELIFSGDCIFTINLTLLNLSSDSFIIDDIVLLNNTITKFINFTVPHATIVQPKQSHILELSICFPKIGVTHMTQIAVTYRIKATGELHLFKKTLTFELAPADYRHLSAAAPYKRPKPVHSDMDATIIPGERLEFVREFPLMHPLNAYTLPKTYMDIINYGLKEDKLDDAARKELTTVKYLLDVADRVNCLNSHNYYIMLRLLLYLEEHQMRIDIRNYDTTTKTLEMLQPTRFRLDVPNLAENRPSLVLGDSVYLKEPGSSIKFEGKVHEKRLDQVTLGMDAKFGKIFIAKKTFEVTFGLNRTTLKLEHQAAELAKGCSQYFFPTAITDECDKPDIKLKWFNRNLERNPQQQQAVQRIVQGRVTDVPYLIFGPPGTGKTMTVVEAILQVRTLNPDSPILVCAPSNSAANLLGTRLLQYGKSKLSKTQFFRYISYSFPISQIPPELLPYCNVKDGYTMQPSLETLLKFKIVITTLVTAGRLYNIGVAPEHFKYVFVDESGHATETETLIPITILKGLEGIKGRVILAGDPEQLGPIIHSTKAKEYGFARSMLERLMKTIKIYQRHDGKYDDRVLTKLLKNYRSHPEIIAIPNSEFYDNELEPVGNELSNLALGHEVLPNPKFPMLFHSVIGTDQQECNSPSFFNVQEIVVIVSYLEKLINSRMCGRTVTESDIAVITPYRKQADKLRIHCGMISSFDHKKLTIGSVELLQGQERLIVIISTVRSKPEFLQHDAKFHLGFLKNPKRFNVAITRAKSLVIVIGNPRLLKYDAYWGKYIDKCIANDAYLGPQFNPGEDDNNDGENPINGFADLRIEDDVQFGRGQL